jgi:hypothetical protein
MPSTSSSASGRTWRTARAISGSGFSTPVDVSLCVTNTVSIWGSARSVSASTCGSTAVPGSTLICSTSTPYARAILAMRSPK